VTCSALMGLTQTSSISRRSPALVWGLSTRLLSASAQGFSHVPAKIVPSAKRSFQSSTVNLIPFGAGIAYASSNTQTSSQTTLAVTDSPLNKTL